MRAPQVAPGPHEGYDDSTGTAPDGRVWITRARYKRLVGMLTGGAPALENQVKQVLNTEFAIIDPLPLLAITPEAKGALIELLWRAWGGGRDSAFVERLLSEHLEVVDA